MNKALNFLYCFDEGYNIQTEISITSILNKTSCFSNFFIIHKNPETFIKTIEKLKINFPNSKFHIYKFGNELEVFPNIKNSHVSEATYYRLFIENYLNDIDHILYIDSDVICINDPGEILKSTIKELKESKKMVGVTTEHFLTNENAEPFNRLELINNKYFNAGVMLIDLEKWNASNMSYNLTTILKSYSKKIKFWDQDVLNKFFDGDYLELSWLINFRRTHVFPFKFINNNAIFLHYSGKQKPWTIKGALFLDSIYYHEIYKEIFEKNYHIISKGKIKAIKDLLFAIFSLKAFKLNRPISFIWSSLKSIFI